MVNRWLGERGEGEESSLKHGGGGTIPYIIVSLKYIVI